MPRPTELIDVPYNSYSRLECYTQCSYKYKNRYVDEVEIPKTLHIALIRGTLFHNCVEAFNLSPERSESIKLDVFIACLEDWVVNDLEMAISFNQVCELAKLAKAYGEIITRASERGKENRILNSDGTVPKSLEDYPPRAFTKEVDARGLTGGIMFWKTWAANQNEVFWSNSFPFLVAECYSMFADFQWAEWIRSSVGVEYGLSTTPDNLVNFRGEENDGNNIYLRGFIDWIVLTKTDRTCFLDHKTSKLKPTEKEVLHHPQLNLYCQASLELFGEIPDYIGIYHARSAEYIVAVPKRPIVDSFYSLFKKIQTLIDQGVYVKNHPGLFGSPCKSYNFKTKGYTYCDYIDKCWPNYQTSLEIDV